MSMHATPIVPSLERVTRQEGIGPLELLLVWWKFMGQLCTEHGVTAQALSVRTVDKADVSVADWLQLLEGSYDTIARHAAIMPRLMQTVCRALGLTYDRTTALIMMALPLSVWGSEVALDYLPSAFPAAA